MGGASSKQKSLRAASSALKHPIALNRVQAQEHVHVPLPGSQRPQSIQKDGQDPQTGEDPEFAKRLKQLGTVNFREISRKYVESNEMLGTIQSRQKLELQADKVFNKTSTSPKPLIHPETITAVLQSRSEGDSDDIIARDFNLDPQVLRNIGTNISIPKITKRPQSRDHDRRSVFRKEHEESGPVLDR
jgi:hypothetical protein